MKPKNLENPVESSQNLAKNENVARAAENLAKTENASGVASDVAKTAMSAPIFRGEKATEVDPMAEYYGMDAFTVAKKLFGENFDKAGEFYSMNEEDVAFKVMSYGTGSVNSRTLVLHSGRIRPFSTGILNNIVISKEKAERLARNLQSI